MPGNRKHGCMSPGNLSISQNFLTSAATIDAIVRKAAITKNDHILEIGPGKGHITKALLKAGGRVTAVELDAVLYRKLQQKFDGAKNLRLVHQDFLKYALPGGSYKVFSSIPYNRTTEILCKLTQARNPPVEIWLVMEKGAAKRFSGKPCENRRSLLLKPYFDLEIVYYFRREDFHPMPGVDSVLLHLKRKTVPDIPTRQTLLYKRFIEAGLNGGITRFLTAGQISKALRAASHPQDFTPSHMLYVQWLCLFRQWAGRSSY